MKIVIAEASTAHNIGSMALIENAVKIARSVDHQCEITIFSNERESVRKTLEKKGNGENIVVTDDLFLFPDGSNSLLDKVFWLLKTVLWILWIRLMFVFSATPQKFIWGKRKKLLQVVSQSDYVFCIGAERINDVYYKTAYLSLETLDIFLKMKAKLIHFSLTIGPVFNRSTIRKASKVLNRSYAIFVRDQKSFDLLKELNVTKPYRFNSFDIAIMQDRLSDEEGLALEKRLGLPSTFVGCSVIDWFFHKCKGPVRLADYYKAVAETLDYIIEKYDIDVVLTPTVVGSYRVDDVKAGEKMMKYVKHKDRVLQIKELLSPSELSYVFSRSKFSIVTRMHAAILCTGAGNKPIISINYLYKLREYMKNIGFEDYSVDIDYVTSKDLIELVDRMFENYEENRSKLTDRLSHMRYELQRNIKSLKW